MGDTKQSDRSIRVVEYRRSSTGTAPWEECANPEHAFPEPVSAEWGASAHDPYWGYWYQRRVVPYVPESELERYRAVVDCFVANMLRDRCPSCVVKRWRHQDDCLLVANGFITKEGAVVK